MTAPEEIRLETRGDVEILTLARPKARNALTWQTYRELEAAVRATRARCLIVTGDDPASCQLIGKLFETQNPEAAKVKRIAIVGGEDAAQCDWVAQVGFIPDAIVSRPCTAEKLFQSMDRLFGNETQHVEGRSEAPDAPTTDLPGDGVEAIADLNPVHPVPAGVSS